MSGASLPQDKLPKQRFLEIIRAASGVSVSWDTDPSTQQGEEGGGEPAWIELGVSGTEDVGWDEQRAEPNTKTVPPTQDVVVVGRRWCTLNLMAYSTDPSIEAYDLCGRVRMGFNRQSVHDLMAPTIALRWCERVVRLPHTVQDGRILLRANMDIQMAYTVVANVGNAGPVDYILDAGTIKGTTQP